MDAVWSRVDDDDDDDEVMMVMMMMQTQMDGKRLAAARDEDTVVRCRSREW